MRILQLITLSELGGAQSVVANLATRLSEIGHEVIVAAGEGDGKTAAEASDDRLTYLQRCKFLSR